MKRWVFLAALCACAGPATATHGFARDVDSPFALGKSAVESLAGCYLVDYSYTETESLAPNYVLDRRVYDVNSHRSVKEWVTVTELSPTRLWLQHILVVPNFDLIMKHEAEDWVYDAPSLYAFAKPGTWERHEPPADTWTRRVTNLDDGPRYQCAAAWTVNPNIGYPEWTCGTYAPIPGRETRDMGRKDYNTLQRSSRLIAYGSSWLERQLNVKTREYADGKREPLAREFGKTWYVRLPDEACATALPFIAQHQAFWTLVREVWDDTLRGVANFSEKTPAGAPPRFAKMADLEDTYVSQDLSDPKIRAAAEAAIRTLIDTYRDGNALSAPPGDGS